MTTKFRKYDRFGNLLNGTTMPLDSLEKNFNKRTTQEKNESNENKFFAQIGREVNSQYSALNTNYNTIRRAYTQKEKGGKWSRSQFNKKEMPGLKYLQEQDREAWEKDLLVKLKDYKMPINDTKTRYQALLAQKRRFNNNKRKTEADLEMQKAERYNNPNEPGLKSYKVEVFNQDIKGNKLGPGEMRQMHAWNARARNAAFLPLNKMTKQQLAEQRKFNQTFKSRKTAINKNITDKGSQSHYPNPERKQWGTQASPLKKDLKQMMLNEQREMAEREAELKQTRGRPTSIKKSSESKKSSGSRKSFGSRKSSGSKTLIRHKSSNSDKYYAPIRLWQ